jgi:phosphonate degradation associated HDIG domain protein
MTADVVEEIFALFARRGGAHYGEGVTQTEHALQAALAAERTGAPPTLVTAALLHDLGHLLQETPEDIAEQGVDTEHESVASACLSRHFGPEVTEPIRLHVLAKRYLCQAESGYWDLLSPASRLSLELQGGPLSESEAAAFRAGAHAEAAIALRRWDDEAKVVGMKTPGLGHYRSILAAGLKR